MLMSIHAPFRGWTLGALSLCAVLASAPGYADVAPLPNLGSSAQAEFSATAEARLGREAMGFIRRSSAFVDDAELEAYLQDLGERIARAGGNSGNFQFFLIRDPNINAFALPGGYIGVHTGLVTTARSESELAAVLAHEITHVSQHHWSRTMAAQKERSGLTAAALLASVILAGSGQTVGEAGIALTTAIELQQQLSFSRDFEREADRIGIQLLANAGFDPNAMGGFFEKLQSSNRLNESGPEYLRTHPITSNRLAEAYDRARRLNGRKSRNPPEDFRHAQARILALYSDSPKQAEAGLDRLFTNRIEAAYRYGRALTLLRARNFSAAGKLTSELQREYPDTLRYRMLEADILVQSKKIQSGLHIYESIYQKQPAKKEILMRYATVLIANGQFETAYHLLGGRRTYPATNPRLQQMFARAAGETGHLVESHRAMADFYYLSGNVNLAIEQLNIARRLAKNDTYSIAGIDAQLKELESEKSD